MRPWGAGAKRWLLLACALGLHFVAAPLSLPAADLSTPPVVTIPRLNHPPELEHFLTMKPSAEMEGRMARVESFIQRTPSDGQPSTQPTVVYMGYDDKNLYLIFVCFDTEPEKIRARMMPRESIFGDDRVEVMLDTFNDRRRAYSFQANPLGLQLDALWSEGRRHDTSFDTLWHSRGQLTERGFVVWMAIPFKSLRFSTQSEQVWGLILKRDIQRADEEAFWPRVSSRVEGRLNQAATLRGLQDVSPGRNIQLIPYGAFRSFRAVDTRDEAHPRFRRDRADPDAGLDAKFVFKDSLVLDVALSPDFSQVESDEPQVTANQRFEVFFPEKRPFFLENASFFETPMNLLFTRRIADPQFGARLTGKLGPYALGAFVIDDESPGKRVLPGDPDHGQRALFSIVRVSRDLWQQSTLGFICTDREFRNTYNRVGGVDGRLKFGQNWILNFQGVASATGFLDSNGELARMAGPAYDVELVRSGRSLYYQLGYNDRSPGFRTDTGFLPRADIRRFGQNLSYLFWPESKHIINWGPRLYVERVHDHEGTRLDWGVSPAFDVEFVRQTRFTVFYNAARERLRPQDFPGLTRSLDFSVPGYGFEFSSEYFSSLTVSGFAGWGKRINFAPPGGQEPFLADENRAEWTVTLRPMTLLRIDNTYILLRLKDRASGASILNNHIFRSKWNYQFNRELSLRVILQYDTALTNPELTSLPTRKNFNADFLLTYLLHPGTALFIGYNGNAQNLDPSLRQIDPPDDLGFVRPRRRFINDAKQFFIKFSYLYRF
jgi:hypothetical protein